MGEYDFTDNLVSLKRFCSSADASSALALLESEGIDGCLEEDSTTIPSGEIGTDLVGKSLLVRQGDYRRAKEILADWEEDKDEADGPVDDYDADADDWSGEDWADDSDDEDEEYREEPHRTPPAIRAWRAAVMGIIFLPMNLYSWWLIVNHELWSPEPGHTTNNRWRFSATVIFNLIGLLFFWALIRYWL